MEEIGRRKSLHEGVPRPCDYFDLIGGTNSGGLLAIMLGRLRMVNPLVKLLADLKVGGGMH